MRRAFTLIEVVVGIAVLGALLAIGLVVIGHVRRDTRNMVSLSNLRTHSQVFAVYGMDYMGALPYFTRQGFESTIIEGGGVRVRASFFDAHRTWHVALVDEYYQADARSAEFWPPRYVRDYGGHWPYYTPYMYACVFITDARYWNERTRTGPDQYGATRMAQVTFPASKSLMIEAWPYTSDVLESGRQTGHRLPVALCDGSARRVGWDERRRGYGLGDGYEFNWAGAVHYEDSPPLLHTIDGVHGRDLQ